MGGHKFPFREPSNIDGDHHSLFVRGVAEIRPMKGNGLSSLPRDRDANEISIADNAIGRIEFNPAGAGQVDLAPRVR